MKISFWHHTADQQPPKSGHYLAYRGWGMGGKADSDSDHGYVYYDKKRNEWRDYESISSNSAIVYYWTDAAPDEWVAYDPPVTKRKDLVAKEAEIIAFEQVLEAIKRYETVKALSR